MAAAIRKKTKPVSSSHANSTGVVKVHESVIASIVRKAALDVEGVLRLGTSSLMDNLAEIVGSKKIQDRSITVEMNESSVSVELRVILQYGVEIPQVATERNCRRGNHETLRNAGGPRQYRCDGLGRRSAGRRRRSGGITPCETHFRS